MTGLGGRLIIGLVDGGHGNPTRRNAIQLAIGKTPRTAQSVFAEKLDLLPVDEQMGMPFYEVGGSKLFLYESPYAGTNQATAVCFDVPNVEVVVHQLQDKGVEFEHYDMPGMTVTGDVHVMEGTNLKSAWLKDTEGNILNINQTT